MQVGVITARYLTGQPWLIYGVASTLVVCAPAELNSHIPSSGLPAFSVRTVHRDGFRKGDFSGRVLGMIYLEFNLRT